MGEGGFFGLRPKKTDEGKRREKNRLINGSGNLIQNTMFRSLLAAGIVA